MATVFSKEWLRGAAERAVKTAAQTAAAVLAVDSGFHGVNFTIAGLTIGGATLASLITSVISPASVASVAPAVAPAVAKVVAEVEKEIVPAFKPPVYPDQPANAAIPVFAPPPAE